MAKDKFLYKKRTFLNPESDGGLAAIDAKVNLYQDGKGTLCVDASIGFTDCSNQIYLDFDVWSSSRTKQTLKERRKKLNHIRTIVNAFLDACEEGYQAIEDQTAAKQKNKKK